MHLPLLPASTLLKLGVYTSGIALDILPDRFCEGQPRGSVLVMNSWCIKHTLHLFGRRKLETRL